MLKKSHLRERDHAVDLCKIIAAFGVVAIHVSFDTKPAELVGQFFSPICVPFFYFIALVYFTKGLLKDTTLDIVWRKMFKRLIIPFLAWTCIYMFLLIIKRGAHGQVSVSQIWRAFLFGESAVQLYFIPQLIVMQLLAYAIYSMVILKKIVWPSIIFLSCLFHLFIGFNFKCFGVTPIISLVFYLFVAFLVGSLKQIKNSATICLTIGLILFSMGWVLNNIALDNIILREIQHLPLIGVGLGIIALVTPLTFIPSWLHITASATFGIYLSHVVFLEMFEFAAKYFSSGSLYYNLEVKIFVTSVVFFLSLIFVLLIRNIYNFKRFLLGEN